MVRLTSSNIKPALKGEVAASATSRRRGCIGSALVCVNPSANPPCGVLPAPRKGEPFGAPLAKSCPRLRGKWTRSGRKGKRLNQPKSPSCSPSVGLRRQLPRKRWRLFARFYLNFILAPPVYSPTVPMRWALGTAPRRSFISASASFSATAISRPPAVCGS